jgi:hypothetical protein
MRNPFARTTTLQPPWWAVQLLQNLQALQRAVATVQVEIRAVLANQQVVLTKQENLMALSDDVAAAVQRVEASDSVAVGILKQLAADSAVHGSVPDSVLQDALARLNAAAGGLETETATDTPPAPVPAPSV